MGDAVASTHFVIDTSRNGNGPNNMQTYASAPYDQPASVITGGIARSPCAAKRGDRAAPGLMAGVLPRASTAGGGTPRRTGDPGFSGAARQ
jgi:hypothetical protein